MDFRLMNLQIWECPPPPPSAMAQEEPSLGDAQARVHADAVTAPGDAQQRECTEPF